MSSEPSTYYGRLAPTPTGELHLGHARTFYQAWKRARDAGGQILMRIEDLDQQRCKPEFTQHALEDLKWLGLDWDGDIIIQSQYPDRYLAAWQQLKDGGWIYPCTRPATHMKMSDFGLSNTLDSDFHTFAVTVHPEWITIFVDRVETMQYATPFKGRTWYPFTNVAFKAKQDANYDEGSGDMAIRSIKAWHSE